MASRFENYHAPRWLPGGHAQTVYPMLIKVKTLFYRRERWDTPDGDFIDLDWTCSANPSTEGTAMSCPLVVLFHGLEGSSGSHYATALMHAVETHGWVGVVCHFRGCSGEPNRLPRAYHSGDADDVDWILRRLRRQFPQRLIYVVGVSLGGNALLKWMGEREIRADEVINGAASICAPLDLAICGHHLARGFNMIYTRHFLATLKKSAAQKLMLFPGIFDQQRMMDARSLHDFDDVVTAPLHGFRDADD